MQMSLKVTDELSQLLYNTFNWVKEESMITNVKLGSADGIYTESLTGISNIKMIIVTGSSPATITITKDGVPTALAIESVFAFSPSEVDRDLIESISITALNATASLYTVSVYGEAT